MAGHLGERGCVQTTVSQRVVAMSVKAGGDQHEIGLKRLGDWNHDVLDQPQPQKLLGTGRDRQVDRVVRSSPPPMLVVPVVL